MIFRPTTLSVLCLASALLLTACGGDNDAPINPGPPPTQVTETFSSVDANAPLTPFSARIHQFNALSPGSVDLTVVSLDPEDAVVGLDLGTWTGTACQVGLSKTDATTGTVLRGTATTVATLCFRVYDVLVDGLDQPVHYVVSVAHF